MWREGSKRQQTRGVSRREAPEELLATNKWFLVNSLGQDIVEGGPFTRKDPASGNESCLDLFIVSENLLPYVKRLLIDSKQEFAVARSVRLGGNHQLIYSDHYSCLLTLTNLPRVQSNKTKCHSVWNLKREGGWESYKKLTEEYSEKIVKAIEKDNDIEEKMKEFQRINDKIKYQAFGKVTIGRPVPKEVE